VTVLGNSGGLIKTGFVFSGWNAQADGLGTNYAPASTFTINANTTLFAKWVADTTLATDSFRSQTSGNWNIPATWLSSHTGTFSDAITATLSPTSSAATITVQSGHTVTVTASVHTDQTICSGTLTVNNGVILTIDDGTGPDLGVTGTVNVLSSGVITGSGSVVFSPGSTLGIGSAAGITVNQNSGSIQSTSPTFDPAANYVYNAVGGTGQSTGTGLPANITGSLTINTAAGVTLSQATSVAGTLTLTQGALTTGANTVVIGTSGSVTRGSGYVIGNLSKIFRRTMQKHTRSAPRTDIRRSRSKQLREVRSRHNLRYRPLRELCPGSRIPTNLHVTGR